MLVFSGLGVTKLPLLMGGAPKPELCNLAARRASTPIFAIIIVMLLFIITRNYASKQKWIWPVSAFWSANKSPVAGAGFPGRNTRMVRMPRLA